MKNIVVIIPVHKPILGSSEEKSLTQCKRILYKYDVYLVYPDGMNIKNYLEVWDTIIPFPVPTNWLNSITSYNKMKCSLNFYQLFEKYNYMLTYELDAYIFSDDWESANTFKYDFIGAPWLKDWNNKSENFLGLGNSGFSMRNINNCIIVLNKIKRIKGFWKFYRKTKLHLFIRLTLFLRLTNNIWRLSGNNKYIYFLTTDERVNEDLFWAVYVPKIFKFKVATIKDAISFSFEQNPSYLFRLNNFCLPIGCHAFEKYDFDFWKKYIL